MNNKGYSRLVSDPASSNTFVQDALQQQDTVIREQDEDLENISGSLHTLKNMSHQIGSELQDQADLLDDLESTMHRTENRMDGVMKKIAKVTNMDDDARQWKAIFFLIGLIVVLLMILIAF
ncbi:T-SNARE coiled-coil-like proteiny domain-containing protein [Aphelenchoides fujianensis]|nr:T-SNARE coiled-coil-like proteiny domain-containing protein [Aphelenchoides fujianensis]